ncbi:MAG: tetratricopeptide repeat protein [Prevotella sp.]
MKRLTFLAALAALATTAFAQDDLVKQAQKLSDKGEFEEAIKVITPALTSEQTADKAAAWNTLSNIYYNKFISLDKIGAEYKLKQSGPQCDSLEMYNCIVESYVAASKCDEYDSQLNEKGKAKLKYRKESQERFFNGRFQLIFAGQYFHSVKDDNRALKAWGLYVDSANDPLFTGVDMSKDQNRSLIAYYAGLLAYQAKDFQAAGKYAEIAAEDPERAADANEIVLFSKRDGAKTAEDSLAYVNTLKELHKQNPDEERYFNMLQNYYVGAGNLKELGAWAEEEIALNANNKMAWALKGEVEMNNQQWDEAVKSYQKAAEIDPTFVQVIFNSGVCLNSKAIELKDKLADKKTGGLTTENVNKVKVVLTEAKGYLEKARELDPSQEKVKWAYPLYQIYYSLGDKAKSAEMEALLGN